jgi:hypothetical protein
MTPTPTPVPFPPVPTSLVGWILANDVWHDFPVILIIVFIFILIGLAARWFWYDYKKESRAARILAVGEAEKDRDWREKQNEKREQAVAVQNELWRSAMAERDRRYEAYDRERQDTLERISIALENVVTKDDLLKHDNRAAEIGNVVRKVEENTRPLPPRRKPNGDK